MGNIFNLKCHQCKNTLEVTHKNEIMCYVEVIKNEKTSMLVFNLIEQFRKIDTSLHRYCFDCASELNEKANGKLIYEPTQLELFTERYKITLKCDEKVILYERLDRLYVEIDDYMKGGSIKESEFNSYWKLLGKIYKSIKLNGGYFPRFDEQRKEFLRKINIVKYLDTTAQKNELINIKTSIKVFIKKYKNTKEGLNSLLLLIDSYIDNIKY